MTTNNIGLGRDSYLFSRQVSAPLYSVFLQTLLSAHHSRPRKKNTITVLFHPTTGRLVVLYVVDPSIFFPFPTFGEDIDPDTSNKEQRSFHMPRQRQCIITLKIPIRLTSTSLTAGHGLVWSYPISALNLQPCLSS